ncbi:Hypothetical predicted protein [Olea europaea subsp. europaea]|uniref:Uncharacterized protein n=1 Tax=Olea europaea subsp. europaea TaxID=158383 RepID=A0A8S0SRH7_OLEEU|nr:Hypothetical predicted protein [Olea europaea subsp. europaea]
MLLPPGLDVLHTPPDFCRVSGGYVTLSPVTGSGKKMRSRVRRHRKYGAKMSLPLSNFSPSLGVITAREKARSGRSVDESSNLPLLGKFAPLVNDNFPTLSLGIVYKRNQQEWLQIPFPEALEGEKSSSAYRLNAIIEKHGDIKQDCSLKSDV